MRLDYRGREREGEGSRGGREAKAGQQQDDEGRDSHRDSRGERETARGEQRRREGEAWITDAGWIARRPLKQARGVGN